MRDKKAGSRNLAEHGRLGIIVLFFWRFEHRLLFGAAAFVINADVVESHILDVMTGNATDDRSVFWFGVINNDIAEGDALERAHGCACWPAHSAAEPKEDWRV